MDASYLWGYWKERRQFICLKNSFFWNLQEIDVSGNKMEVKCGMYLEKVETSESSWTRTCSPKRNTSVSEQENKFDFLEENSVLSYTDHSVKIR